jgi:hypothetical protein
MRVAGNAGVQRDPAGITPHDLHHHHALVALRGAVQAVQAFGGKGHGGVEAESGEGLVQVVVDGLGHADHPQALLVQRVGNRQRAVAADGDQRIELLHRKVVEDFPRAVHVLGSAVGHLHREMQRVALVGGAQDGAAQVGDTTHPVLGEAEHPALGVALGEQDAVEAVPDAITLPAPVDRGNDDRADHRIETGGVAPAGAHGNASNGAGHERSPREVWGAKTETGLSGTGAAPWPPGCGAAGKHRACRSPATGAGTCEKRRSHQCRWAR